MASLTEPDPDRVERSRLVMTNMLSDPEEGPSFRTLEWPAQELYVIGTFICNEIGFIKKQDVEVAARAPAMRAAAQIVLAELGMGPLAN